MRERIHNRKSVASLSKNVGAAEVAFGLPSRRQRVVDGTRATEMMKIKVGELPPSGLDGARADVKTWCPVPSRRPGVPRVQSRRCGSHSHHRRSPSMRSPQQGR